MVNLIQKKQDVDQVCAPGDQDDIPEASENAIIGPIIINSESANGSADEDILPMDKEYSSFGGHEEGVETFNDSALNIEVLHQSTSVVSEEVGMAEALETAVKWHCSLCSFKTQRESHLTKHLALHVGDRQTFTCSQCNFSTLRLAHLRRHEVSQHGEKMHTCGVCNYSTDDMKLLTKHQRMKHKVREFKCFI